MVILYQIWGVVNLQFIVPFLITVAAVFVVVLIINAYRVKIDFYSKGFDNQFRYSEIAVLWRLAKKCNLDNPISLYYSVPTLNKCITMVITQSRHNGTENTLRMQNFLSKLYRFRTRIVLDGEQKRGIDTTKSLDEGQKLQVILKGKGVYYSRVVNNARELVITMPRLKNELQISGSEWEGRRISVYLWRKGDASYVFDTIVAKAGIYLGVSCLFLIHTNKLIRTQKRQSVRCDCHVYAQMYVIRSSIVDYDKKETEPGYKCLIENISEDGAMIRVGGKGVEDVQIKLQFKIDDVFVMMYGVVRSVEYNKDINQSRLHFECIHIEKNMKNAILSYVYNVIPEVDVDLEDEAVKEITNTDLSDDDTRVDVDENLLKTGSIYDEIEEQQKKAAEVAAQANADEKSEEGKNSSLEQRSSSFETQVSDFVEPEDDVDMKKSVESGTDESNKESEEKSESES